LGGRVLVREGRSIVLSDALCQVRVQTAGDCDFEPGFLVVFDGTWTREALTNAGLVWASAAAAPAAGGEFSRLLFDGVGPRLAKRAQALKIARRHFEQHSFIEVETPSRVRAPNLDANIEPVAASGAWLVTSPELHLKRLIVGGLPRVFEFARCHRAEELGAYHEPEFTMLEWYRAFEPVEAVMRDAETLVRSVVADLSGKTALTHRGIDVDLGPAFDRVTVAQAFGRHSGEDGLELAKRNPEVWFQIWVETIEPALARYPRPVFVTEYPAPQAALARKNPNNPEVAERFELYCAGVELCNGFGELTDPSEQQMRFEQELESRYDRGEASLPLDSKFLAALGEGMPPCSGNALGFDRLIMLATGAERIADVQAFGWARN
jgi:lysyl-tRNA synthetase class 2